MKLAEEGDAKAQFTLGTLYSNGKGVPQDDAEAARWFRMAAEQGNEKAQASLRRLTGDQTPETPKP
jgi:TPR repeat protein